MAISKYKKTIFLNQFISGMFICSGIYLALKYYIEYPTPALHWEGIGPLIICFFYYLFSSK